MLGILSPNYLCPELSYCDSLSRWVLWCWQFSRRIREQLCDSAAASVAFGRAHCLPFLSLLYLPSPPPAEQSCGYLFIFSQQTRTPWPFQTETLPLKGQFKGLKNFIAYIFLKTEMSGNLQGRKALKENAKFHSNYHHYNCEVNWR